MPAASALATYFAGLDTIERARVARGLDARAFAARLLAIGAVEPRAIAELLAVRTGNPPGR